jgi:hypothetical protein
MVIINETFEAYRLAQKKIKKATKLLKNNGFVVYKKTLKKNKL